MMVELSISSWEGLSNCWSAFVCLGLSQVQLGEVVAEMMLYRGNSHGNVPRFMAGKCQEGRPGLVWFISHRHGSEVIMSCATIIVQHW